MMLFKSGVSLTLATTAVAAAFVAVPTAAQAADPCTGALSVTGIGASFQRDAHSVWGATILNPDPKAAQANGFGYLDGYHPTTNPSGTGCPAFAIGGGQTVSYEPRGSGDGRAAFGAATGVRNTAYAFGGADEPPTTAQLAVANDGPTSGSADDAVLHTIPVAQSAVAVVVKLPATCTVAASAAKRQISRAALAAAFAGTATTWSAILPSGAAVGAGCSTPVKRVVRLDSSGTTFAFKNYLNAIDPTTFPPALGNTAWPNDVANPVIRPAANGAGAQLDTLKARADGGIAYADLATARDRGFDWATGGGAGTDPTFWLHVERADAAIVSPAVNDNAGVTGANRGANCVNAQYKDAGAPLPTTTASWAKVSAVSTSASYPICALTYALAWQQASKANDPSTPTAKITAGQALAVKSYLGFAVDVNTAVPSLTKVAGQSQLAAAGYAPLPEAVRGASVAGVNAIGW